MKGYTYSEARQNFAAVLEEAKQRGAVQIRRRDGTTFVIRPQRAETSPLDVKGSTRTLPSRSFLTSFAKAGATRNRAEANNTPAAAGYRGADGV